MRSNLKNQSRQIKQSKAVGLAPDFRVSYSRIAGWQIEIISPRAHVWAELNARPVLSGSNGGLIRTDLVGVNLLIHTARSEGLRTEYIGPQRIVLI